MGLVKVCCSLVLLVGLTLVAAIVLFFLSHPKLVSSCRQVKVTPSLLPGQCALVLGSSAGLGKDLANKLAEKGVLVATTGRRLKAAKESLKAENQNMLLLAGYLDLDDDPSIVQFVKDLGRELDAKCNGRLDFLFMNAGMSYALGGDNISILSNNGQHDKLLSANFMGHVKFLNEFGVDKLNKDATRTVFVSSVSHYCGSTGYLSEPFHRYDHPQGFIDSFAIYGTSKLGLTTYQQLIAKEGLLPNSISMTCGIVSTAILNPKRHQGNVSSQLENNNYWPVAFTSEQGADIVLQGAFLVDKVKLGEFVLPYHFVLADYAPYYQASYTVRVLSAVAVEVFQKLTYRENHLYICPVSQDARSPHLQEMVRRKYALLQPT